MKNIVIVWITTILFLIFGVAFFLPNISLPYKTGYPILILTLGLSFFEERKMILIMLALFLSFIGDTTGAMHYFIFQMLFFALAHIFYIVYFLSDGSSLSLKNLFYILIPISLLAFLFIAILPSVNNPIERIGVTLYGVIISTMLGSVFLYKGKFHTGYIIAAMLFVFSDSIIAWNRFVSIIPYSKYIIMTTYYIAQYLFFYLTVKQRNQLKEKIS
ncbi:MAG: lysoplasmalogenase [Bacteroidales bacterium]|nr:lysoplasmalogenase [Bacteroidales bacterium]